MKSTRRTYGNELETYLRARCTAPSTVWDRDYSSVEAYVKSVAANRERWRDVLGRFDGDAIETSDVYTRPYHDGDDYVAEWVTFDFLPDVNNRAVVAVPKNASGKPPVVICQHSLNRSPFHVLGAVAPNGL
jgi:hypothetical protein